MPDLVIDTIHANDPDLHYEFLGKMQILAKECIYDNKYRHTQMQQPHHLLMTQHHEVDHFDLIDGSVNSARPTSPLNHTIDQIIIRIESDQYQFEDLDEITFNYNPQNAVILRTSPQITQINHPQIDFTATDIPVIYTILTDPSEFFTLGRIDNLTLTLKSQPNITANGTVHVHYLTKNILAIKGGICTKQFI